MNPRATILTLNTPHHGHINSGDIMRNTATGKPLVVTSAAPKTLRVWPWRPSPLPRRLP